MCVAAPLPKSLESGWQRNLQNQTITFHETWSHFVHFVELAESSYFLLLNSVTALQHQKYAKLVQVSFPSGCSFGNHAGDGSGFAFRP